jgi:hypothetical protein
MNETHRFMHNTFWVDNQVSFTFAPPLVDPEKPIEEIINLSDLATFLGDQGVTLQPWGDPGPSQEADADLTTQLGAHNYPGIYVFPTSLHMAEAPPVVAAFFQFEGQPAAPQAANASQEDHQANQDPTDLSSTAVAQIVNLVNGNLDKLRKGGEILKDGKELKPIPILAAAPNWYCGASNGGSNPNGPVTTGCPLTPPIPVAAEAKCASSTGLWPIRLPELAHELKTRTGDGVPVLVLDSLPSENDIKRAAQAAGEHNLLLLDLMNNVTFTRPDLPEILERPSPQQTMTGKDIKGKAVGFRMPDHGLFVAGIIRDIAPNARVECIRVLNDYCAGTVQVLTEQLYEILQRLLKGGNLYGRDVVINMSLVIPDDEDVQTSGIDLKLARLGLGIVIQTLSDRDVIFVASAGNEGDSRYMKPKGKHPNALYPAAYAYSPDKTTSLVANMIPVGAVKRNKKVSSYSCYPGLRGVSTYGGEIPAESAIFIDKETHMTEVDTRTIDAVIGVYTQLSYPALSIDDPEATYPVPNAHGWAYWIGTSFATPIISAIVARALELRRRTPSLGLELESTDAIIRYSTKRKVSWLTGSGESSTDIDGPMVLAQQCRPYKKENEGQEAQNQAEHDYTTPAIMAGTLSSDH